MPLRLSSCAAVASAADRATWKPPSSLMQVVFSSPWAPSSLLWLAQTLHTDCRSFTSCQGKARLEGAGQASLTAPNQPRWGECRPFTRGLGKSSTICLLPLKIFFFCCQQRLMSFLWQPDVGILFLTLSWSRPVGWFIWVSENGSSKQMTLVDGTQLHSSVSAHVMGLSAELHDWAFKQH